jgi:hypothetical protein
MFFENSNFRSHKSFARLAPKTNRSILDCLRPDSHSAAQQRHRKPLRSSQALPLVDWDQDDDLPADVGEGRFYDLKKS